MLIYDEKKYKKYIDEETVLEIEETMGVKCLFGGAVSTRVYEIDNGVSDFDFYMIIDKQNTSYNMYQYFDETTLTDIILLDLQYVLLSSEEYIKGIDAYPSILHRKDNNRVSRNNVQRNDFAVNVFFAILYSDYMWDSGYLKEQMDKCLEGISFIGVLDYYFSRLHGNLKNNLCKEKVHAQKYLMAFLGYTCIKWILQCETIPIMRFEYMCEMFCPEEHREFLYNTCKKQRRLQAENVAQFHVLNAGDGGILEVSVESSYNASLSQEKPIIMVDKNEQFNKWLEEEMSILTQEIKNISLRTIHPKLKIGDVAFCAKYFM